jgi:chromosome segregation and condensation protein ScpB
LTDAQLQVVVAVVAAEFSQMTPVTLREIEARVSCCPKAMMHALTKAGWVAEVGQVKGRTAKLYGPTARAWRDLGLLGWSLLKEVA